jgi:hypothetical protein
MITMMGRRRGPRGHHGADGGSMPLAMLLILVGSSLSALLVPIVVNQLSATRTSSERTLALHAAEAGIHTAMGQFRAAADSTGAGDSTRLPAGPLTGSISPDGRQRYQVTITYRTLDGNTLTMPLAGQPASAVLVSTGVAAATGSFGVGTAGTRTLQATYTFQPYTAVGTGAAGAATRQLVNFKQFGRCLVTVNYTGSSYLIAWPCQQAPNAADVSWDQKWSLPTVSATTRTGTARIYTTLDGVDYCLRSPGTTAGAYPAVSACSSSSIAATMTWTVYGATGTYATSYQIVDSAGLCLAPVDPAVSPTEVYNDVWYTGPPVSRIVMQTCDGSAWQKWDAPPDLSGPLPLTRIYER